MNNGGLVRLTYYRGQMLTARDFEDQQEYHRRKQRLLLRRFPTGIIGGLEVICQKKSAEDPADFDGFLIQEGSAVDSEGNELVVPEGGLKVPTTEFIPEGENHYLSLVYDEQKDFVGGDVCGGSSQKNNRIKEGVKAVWDPSPNIDPHVTVAFIKLKDPKDTGTTCDKFLNPMESSETVGAAPVRKNARVVDTEQLTTGAVTTDKIKNGAVKKDKIATGAVVGDKILDGAVTDKKLALDAVITEKIKNGAVNADKLDADAVVEAKIKDDAVTENKIKNDAVTENKIKNDAVTENKIKNDAVTENKIINNAVTENKIKNDAVTEFKIKNDAVTEFKIKNDAVTEFKLKNDSVTELKIKNDAVTDAKIRNDAVTDLKIKNDAVTENKIKNDAVTENKIKNDAVTENKIKNDAVTENKIKNDAVTENKIINNAVTENKIKNDAVTENKIKNDAVTVNKIANGAVTREKLRLVTDVSSGTANPAGEPAVITNLIIPESAILSVVPVIDPNDNPPDGRELSWTSTAKTTNQLGMVNYTVRVTAVGDLRVTFKVKVIAFN
jgi:hypothetical protein